MRPPPRRVAGTSSNIINDNSKRRERNHDGFDKPTTVPTPPKITKLSKPNKPIAEPKPELIHKSSIPKGVNNQLLAGYMAHEFLTKGTLLGRKVGPEISMEVEPLQQKRERYVDVTELMKTNGTHLPAVVNPTQLGPVLGPFR